LRKTKTKVPVSTSPSEPELSSSEPPQSSTGDEYHPSPVPSPVLYIPSCDSSPDEGVEDMQHMIGEFMGRPAETCCF
jgi:hypothetical protein